MRVFATQSKMEDIYAHRQERASYHYHVTPTIMHIQYHLYSSKRYLSYHIIAYSVYILVLFVTILVLAIRERESSAAHTPPRRRQQLAPTATSSQGLPTTRVGADFKAKVAPPKLTTYI